MVSEVRLPNAAVVAGSKIMKRAVSISLGSRERDKKATLDVLGQSILVERIGTDGDVEQAARLYRELDGQVDALGVGGLTLAVGTDRRHYPLRAAQKLVMGVRHTPVVDGTGLKDTLEYRAMRWVEQEIGSEISPKRAMNTSALDRYGMCKGLVEAGYDTVFCDLMFALGIPVPLKSLRQVEWLARVLAPVVMRLPISMIYPTGEKQHESVPKFARWYRWASIVSGDCLYVKRHMPSDLGGKTVLTNTTTEADVADFGRAGVRYLVTTTPRLDGRSFGTNMMEAALVAASGKGRPLSGAELEAMIAELGWRPEILKLNG